MDPIYIVFFLNKLIELLLDTKQDDKFYILDFVFYGSSSYYFLIFKSYGLKSH